MSLILAIETSCDETSAAIVSWTDGIFHVHSNVIASQAAKHAPYGGVVPELATREHLATLEYITRSALEQANIQWSQLEAIAATRGPGLASSLLMGHSFAKTLAISLGLPFIGINHIEGHLYSPFLSSQTIPLKSDSEWLSLIVSGGHTLLIHARFNDQHTLLGSTRDDAAGEAFDKGAKLLGLGYPGGPILEKTAVLGNPHSIEFPQGLRYSNNLDFSFSGLKTALRVYLQKHFSNRSPSEQERADLCASYQSAIVQALATKTRQAIQQTKLPICTVAGGVACNRTLRNTVRDLCQSEGVTFLAAEPQYCTDNAAMIAGTACLKLLKDKYSSLDEEADPNLNLNLLF